MYMFLFMGLYFFYYYYLKHLVISSLAVSFGLGFFEEFVFSALKAFGKMEFGRLICNFTFHLYDILIALFSNSKLLRSFLVVKS